MVSRSAVIIDRLVIAQGLVFVFSMLLGMPAAIGGAFVFLILWIPFTMGLGLALGSLCTLWFARNEAVVAYAAWRRREHWLHLPWLAGQAVGIVVGVTLLFRGKGPNDWLVGATVLTWLLATIVLYGRWLFLVWRDAAQFKIGTKAHRVLVSVAGLVLIAATSILGGTLASASALVFLRR